MPIRVAGEVKGFDPVAVAGARRRAAWTATSLLALAAAQAAADDASLVVDDPTRAGVLFGTAIGGFHTMMEQHEHPARPRLGAGRALVPAAVPARRRERRDRHAARSARPQPRADLGLLDGGARGHGRPPS